MYRLLLIVMLLATAASPIAFAQSEAPLYELSNVFTVTDLGIQFDYPQDWVFGTNNGIFIAPTKADLNPLLDQDTTTNPNSVYIAMQAFPLADLGFDASMTLDEMVDAFLPLAGVTELNRIELGVLARRSITVVGEDDFSYAYGTFWVQGSDFVIFRLSAPDSATLVELGFTWGVILGSMYPLDAIELTEPYEMFEMGFSMYYPQGWTRYDEEYTLLEFASDQAYIQDQSAKRRGHILAFMRFSLGELGLKPNATPLDAANAVAAIFPGTQSVTLQERELLALPAFGVEVLMVDGRKTQVAGFLQNGNVELLLLGSPDAISAEAFAPTWTAMLLSMQTLD